MTDVNSNVLYACQDDRCHQSNIELPGKPSLDFSTLTHGVDIVLTHGMLVVYHSITHAFEHHEATGAHVCCDLPALPQQSIHLSLLAGVLLIRLFTFVRVRATLVKAVR